MNKIKKKNFYLHKFSRAHNRLPQTKPTNDFVVVLIFRYTQIDLNSNKQNIQALGLKPRP